MWGRYVVCICFWNGKIMHLKKKKKKNWLNLQLISVRHSCKQLWKDCFHQVTNYYYKKRVLLQTVSCFLAIRMSENLGLFSDLYLLTKMQKLHFLTGKRCEVWSFEKASKLPPHPPLPLFPFFNCWRGKELSDWYMDCILAVPQILWTE